MLGPNLHNKPHLAGHHNARETPEGAGGAAAAAAAAVAVVTEREAVACLTTATSSLQPLADCSY